MDNLYFKVLEVELDIIDHGDYLKYADGLELFCYQHGLIKSWPYDQMIPGDSVSEIMREHQETMHV